jgi:hypothetical protein
MSTALVTALRESCGYLRDAGYRQTAHLLVAAADEIEHLRERLQTLEAVRPMTHSSAGRAPSKCLVEPGTSPDIGALPPARRSIGGDR